jgi:hypothetical protein
MVSAANMIPIIKNHFNIDSPWAPEKGRLRKIAYFLWEINENIEKV